MCATAMGATRLPPPRRGRARAWRRRVPLTVPMRRCPHPRMQELRRYVQGVSVDVTYRAWLYRSLERHADQFATRPQYKPEEGQGDLGALQQVTQGDMMEAS